MRKSNVVIFILVLATTVYSKPTIKLGATISNFQNIDDKSVIGVPFGVGWDWQMFKYTSIGFDIMYSEYGGNLKNIKVIKTNARPTVFLYSYDLSVQVGYLLLPLNASVNIPINKSMKLKIGFGKTLPLSIFDLSTLENEKKLLEVEGELNEHKEILNQADYYWGPENSLGPDKFQFSDNHFFIKMQYSRYSFELKYQHDGQFIKRVLRLNEIYEKSHSISIILGTQL